MLIALSHTEFEGARPDADGGITNAFDLANQFSEHVIKQRMLEPSAVARAKRAAEGSSERFDLVLVKLGLLTEADLAVAYADHFALPLASTEIIPREAILVEQLR